MLCPQGPISTNGLLYKHLNYHPQKWVAISHLATVFLRVRRAQEFPGSTIQQLIAIAKAKPDPITFGSAGPGGGGTLSGGKLRNNGGIKLVILSYRGLDPA